MITVHGADQLAALSARIKEIGNHGLRLELLRGNQAAAKPLKAVAERAIRDNVPHRGGLSADVASHTTVGIRTRTSGRTPGVRVIARSRSHIAAMDRGQLRKPVFPRGDDRSKWTWVNQPMPADWWENRLSQEAPAVRAQLIRSMNRVAERVARYG